MIEAQQGRGSTELNPHKQGGGKLNAFLYATSVFVCYSNFYAPQQWLSAFNSLLQASQKCSPSHWMTSRGVCFISQYYWVTGFIKKNKNKKHAENKFDSDTAQNLIEVHHITQHKHRAHCSLICCSQVKHVRRLSQTKRKACVNTGEHWGNTGTDSLFLSLLCHFQQRREGLHSRWLLGSPKSNDGKEKYD